MSDDNVKYGSGGIGFLGLLTILFIALKLIGVITWSWWWILSPLWIPCAAGIAIVILILLLYFIYCLTQ